MYDLLLSADLMVDDPDAVADLLRTKLGVHGHPNWRQAFDGHPYVAHFLRVHKSLAVSPTRIEPQGHLDAPNPGDPLFREHLESLARFQGPHRPIKTHSTVLVSNDIGSIAERLSRRKQPFRVARRTPEMPFDRLWVGVTPENPRYEPSVDGGLCIEIIPLAPIQLPEEAFATPPPRPRELSDGDMIRVAARGFLVRDLDDTLRRLSSNLDLEPSHPVEHFADEGFRRARIRFTVAHSATLDVIEPTGWDSDLGLYMNNWGPGPHYLRIAVHGLDAKAAELEGRGTPFTRLPEAASTGGPALRVDPDVLGGAIVEFIENEPTAA